MSGEELTRTSSVKSDVSTVSLASTDLDSDQLYDTCPWDVYGEAEGLGRVRVVKAGVALPVTTGYKVKATVDQEEEEIMDPLDPSVYRRLCICIFVPIYLNCC